MASHSLYAMAFPDDVLEGVDPSAQRRQSLQGKLQQSVPSTTTIAAEPGERVLRGDFTGQFSEIMAAEVQELLRASDVIDAVPYYAIDDDREWAGYYAPRAQRQGYRRDPRLGNVHTFEGILTPVGSRRSHVRAVRVEPGAETNPFGSDTTETLWLPADARDVRWVHEPTGAVEAATVQTTRAGEHRSFDRYDATEPAFANESAYTLVYDVPYDVEWRTDPRVWDDYGRAKEHRGEYVGDTVGTGTQVGSATVGEQRVVDPAWQRVFLTQHEYVGERVIESDRLRIEPRPDSEVFRAYRWNDEDSTYGVVQLGTSDWRLIDWDVTRIGLARIVSRTRWEDTANRGTTAELVAEVRRGSADVLFYEPENASGSTPSGLTDRLGPIASTTDQALNEQATVIERDEVPDE